MSGATTTQTQRVRLFPVKGLVFGTLPTAGTFFTNFFHASALWKKVGKIFNDFQPEGSLDNYCYLLCSSPKLDRKLESKTTDFYAAQHPKLKPNHSLRRRLLEVKNDRSIFVSKFLR